MITRVQMPRQLRGKGGITNVVPRTNYIFGGIKDRIRKLIPNELADVAVKAAPFVAPFNPGIAGLMRGIGRFDQRGSISDAFKQGIATAGFGAGARALGGADPFGGGLKGGFTSPLDAEKTTKFKTLFERQKADIDLTKTKDKPGFLRKAAEETIGKVPVLQNLSPKVQEKLLAGTITSGASALYSYFTGEFEPQQPGETVGEYLARRNERVKLQMRQVMDSYYTPLRNPEYAAMTPEQKNNFIDGLVGQAGLEGTTDFQGEARATGGRVGYQTGGITMANTLAENIRRNVANQAAVGQMFQAAASKAFPEGKFQQIKASSPTQKDYNIRSTKDLVENLPGGIAKDVLAPAAASVLSLPYDAIQASQRMEPGSGIAGFVDAFKAENPISSLKERTTGAAGPLAERLSQPDIIDVGSDPLAEKTPTPDAGTISQEGVIPGFKRIGERSYQGPDGQVYGSETYSSIAAGMYPDIYDPNKKIIPEEGTIGPITKLPIEPDPDTPIDELIKPIMPTLPVEPRTDQDILEGYEKFKEQNPGAGMGPGLAVMIYGRLPDGTPLTFTNSAQASAFNQYLESIGQPPFERSFSPVGFKDDSGEKSLSKLAGGGMPTGIMKTNKAGVMERDYRDKGGFVPVGIKEKADDVPAMLSKNEFVFTADAVRGAGNGSIEKGAQRMYDTMKNLEKRVT
jgi:hypothetical protein